MQQRIFVVGLGDVGSSIFDLLLRLPGRHHFLVGGRDPDRLRPRTNLSLFSALQLGYTPEVSLTVVDLEQIDQTAEVIAQFQPHIIVCAATLQKWGVFHALPQPLADQFYQAQIGPWLPVHLSLVYKLMQAVKRAGSGAKVVNVTYPDVVHPVLRRVDLAPTTGVGDLANNLPALKLSIAQKLQVAASHVDVRLIAQHHVSYWMSRKGNSGGAPFHLTAFVNGEDRTQQLAQSTLFEHLPGMLKRAPGNQMTAASAAVVFDGLVNDTGKIVHVPGPHGLPGGYPVRVSQEGVQLALPSTITLEEAISLNTTSQQFDGIERIDEHGTVFFAERQMSILKRILGYECSRMPLSEVDDRANELLSKWNIVAERRGIRQI